MRAYLEQVGLFSDSDIDYFLSYGSEKVLEKKEYFLQEGEVAKKVAFVKTGVFRSFYHSSNQDEITYCFCFPNELISGYSSLITGQKTKENIQAITRCELLEFPKQILDELVAKQTNWLLFSKLIAETQYVNLEERIFLLQCETALVRYKKMTEKHPEYLQQIPLGYLASYLGISQRHLSRLRK